MEFTPKAIPLKNGRTALLRSPVIEDAPQMVEFLKTIAGETEFMLRYPEECVGDVEGEKAFLDGILRSDTELMIVCEVDGVLAGNCHLSFNTRLKTRHRATVAIGLLSRFWGLGIGTALFQEMITAARDRGLDHLELDYIEGNERARHLYEKMGFYQVAQVPDVYRLKDGSMRQNVLMIKKL